MKIFQNNLIEINQNGENVNAVLNMPFRHTAKHSTSFEAFRASLENSLRYDVWVMLELTKTIGLALADSDVDKDNISQQLVLLGELGATYAETLDLLQITFDNLQNNIDVTQVLQFAGRELVPTEREILADEVSNILESMDSEQAHRLLESLDDLENKTRGGEFTREQVKNLFIDSDLKDFEVFKLHLQEFKTPKPSPLSFTQKVLNFLQDEQIEEELKDSLIQFFGYEMNEANVSIIDENILPSSLAEFAGTVEPDALQTFKETTAKIMRGQLIWNAKDALKDFSSEEKPLDLSDISAPAENACIDLARHISAVIKDDRTPSELRQVIENYLAMCNTTELTDFIETPEYIASQLCD